jgi:peroxiredoxin
MKAQDGARVAERTDRKGMLPPAASRLRFWGRLGLVARLAGCLMGCLMVIGLVGSGVLATAGAQGAEGTEGAKGAERANPMVGAKAPHFILPQMGSDLQVASDTLFEASGVTLLAFWTTHCAECSRRMEACQQLYDWGEPEGLNVVGVNFDDHPSAKMSLVANSAGPRLLHLYDPAGRMAAIYGAGSHSYSAFLVDERGTIRAAYYEIMPDELLALKPTIDGLLQEALSGGVPSATEGGTAPGGPSASAARPGILTELGVLKEQKIELHGRGRMRWMNIDTTGVGAVGANGEALVPGPSLRYRAELELTYAITPELKAGGFFRLSNEGDLVLRSGPEYLSNPMGSFIMRYDIRGQVPLLRRVESSLIAGYYSIYTTPLILMRWDENDTPVAGGQRAQGCGVCGGAAGMAGFIRLESVEQVEPELSFEGARWNLSMLDHLDLLLMYARPQAPYPERRSACYSTDPQEKEKSYYHQDLYGSRLKGNFALPWTPDPLEIAGSAFLTQDSDELPGCPTSFMHGNLAPMKDRVLGADVKVPLPGLSSIYGEVATSHWDPDLYCEEDCRSADGLAVRSGLVTEWRGSRDGSLFGLSTNGLTTRAEFAYHYIEEDFFSAFSALTYESNLQGPRLSLRADWGRLGAGMYYKHSVPIVEVAPPSFAPAHDQAKQTASAWVDVKPWSGGVFEVGGVRYDRDLYIAFTTIGRIGPENQTTLIASLTQMIAPKCSLFAELELGDGEYEIGVNSGGVMRVETREYSSTVVRAMVDLKF